MATVSVSAAVADSTAAAAVTDVPAAEAAAAAVAAEPVKFELWTLRKSAVTNFT